MRKMVYRLLAGVITVGMLVPISMSTIDHHPIKATASVRYHRGYHHIKRHRRRVHNRRHVTKKQSHALKKNRLVNLTTNHAQMAWQTLRDLNRDRTRHHLNPLREDRSLNRIAQLRARQISYHFSHYDQQGRSYYQRDARRLGVKLGQRHHEAFSDYSGENIANANLDGNDDTTSMPNDPNTYQNRNGYDMANMDDDAMMKYDSGSHWGHRKNILNPHFHRVGLGVAHRDSYYYLAEDFDS